MQCTSRSVAIKWTCGGSREAGALHDVLPDAAALVPVLAPHGACAPVFRSQHFCTSCCRGTHSGDNASLPILSLE